MSGFEWDAAKAARNFSEHKGSFNQAAESECTVVTADFIALWQMVRRS
jgi:uncharacterized DUF497 family protein